MVPAETILAIGYAVFLAAIARVMEMLASHVHRRAQQAQIAGFTYRQDLDVWECPDGRMLHRIETDSTLKIIRYRAEAHHCNRCPFKFRCTDSHSGRLIEQRHDSWLDSGLNSFHRGISLALLALAVMILAVEMVRVRTTAAEVLLAIVMVVLCLLLLRCIGTLRSSNLP